MVAAPIQSNEEKAVGKGEISPPLSHRTIGAGVMISATLALLAMGAALLYFWFIRGPGYVGL